MNNKVLFHTIKIKVPEEMIKVSKNGTLTIKKTLTKTNQLSKAKGEPSINIIQDKNVLTPTIENKGHLIDVDEAKEKKKATQKAKKLMTNNVIPELEKRIKRTKAPMKTTKVYNPVKVKESITTNPDIEDAEKDIKGLYLQYKLAKRDLEKYKKNPDINEWNINSVLREIKQIKDDIKYNQDIIKEEKTK